MVTLEQISTNVLKAPIGSLKCTSCGSGQVGRAEPQHDVRADQAGEEHDLGRQKQPDDQLAVGERQAGMVFEPRPVAMIVSVVGAVFVRCRVRDSV